MMDKDVEFLRNLESAGGRRVITPEIGARLRAIADKLQGLQDYADEQIKAKRGTK